MKYAIVACVMSTVQIPTFYLLYEKEVPSHIYSKVKLLHNIIYPTEAEQVDRLKLFAYLSQMPSRYYQVPRVPEGTLLLAMYTIFTEYPPHHHHRVAVLCLIHRTHLDKPVRYYYLREDELGMDRTDTLERIDNHAPTTEVKDRSLVADAVRLDQYLQPKQPVIGQFPQTGAYESIVAGYTLFI